MLSKKSAGVGIFKQLRNFFAQYVLFYKSRQVQQDAFSGFWIGIFVYAHVRINFWFFGPRLQAFKKSLSS